MHKTIKPAVAVASLVGASTAVGVYSVPVETALGVASSAMSLCLGTIEFLATRQLLVAAYKSLKLLLLALVFGALILGVLALTDLDSAVAVHTRPEIQAEVLDRLSSIKVGFGAIILLAIVTGFYASWKYKATRFAEGRVTLLKDLLLEVRNILGSRSSPAEKRSRGTALCLDTVLAAIELSPWQWLLKKMRIIRRNLSVCTVQLLQPNPRDKTFRIEQASYPKDLTGAALTLLKWIEDNYHPRYLDESAFIGLVQLARGQNPRGWRQRFFNFTGRERVVSAVGWVGAKKEILLSVDARTCRAFDGSFLEQARASGKFEKADLAWARIGSFIACPIDAGNGEVSPVLFVTKSIGHGFVGEDREVVVAISQILGMVLRYPSGEDHATARD